MRVQLVPVIALAALMGTMNVSQAQGRQFVDPIARNQARTSLADHKAAAQRLKVRYAESRQRAMFNADGTPKGYNRHGYTGEGRKGH